MLLPLLALLLAAPTAVAPPTTVPPRDYSVELRRYFHGAPRPDGYAGMTTLFVRGDGATRMETYDEDGKLLSTIIRRPDRSATYTIREGHAYEVAAVGSERVPFELASFQDKERRGVVTLTYAGRDTVADQVCDTYTIRYRNVSARAAIRLWVSTVTGLTVRYAFGWDQTSRIEWSHLRIGPQPASLFEVPAHYEKVAPQP